MHDVPLLTSVDMAEFVARGFLRFDGIVPEEINQQFLSEAGEVPEAAKDSMTALFGVMAQSKIPEIAAGTPLAQSYPKGSAVRRLLDLPRVKGAVTSLVGSKPIFDHHFLHVAFPPRYHNGKVPKAQHTHQDSTIDTRRAFDIQIFYFPHEVTPEMGGTRYIPGTHLRIVSEAAISRYQNIVGQQHVVCPAGSIMIVHHGLWHGGGSNQSDQLRYMLKIRLNPAERQTRLWDTSDLTDEDMASRAIFFIKDVGARQGSVQDILMKSEPWFENDTGRLEYINRIRLWRYLLGDDEADIDYWQSRLEIEPT